MKAKMIVMCLLVVLMGIWGWNGMRNADAAAKAVHGHTEYVGAVSDTTGLGVDPGDELLDKGTGRTWIYDGHGWLRKKASTPDDTSTVKLTAASQRALTRADTVTVEASRAIVSAASDTSRLEAPGAFKAVATGGYTQVGAVIQTTNVATSTTYKFQGKVTDPVWSLSSGWFDMADTTVYLGNNMFFKTFETAALVDSFRVYFWSEAGGTGGTPIVKYRTANPVK